MIQMILTERKHPIENIDHVMSTGISCVLATLPRPPTKKAQWSAKSLRFSDPHADISRRNRTGALQLARRICPVRSKPTSDFGA